MTVHAADVGVVVMFYMLRLILMLYAQFDVHANHANVMLLSKNLKLPRI
jgi:hypothetical protein